MIKCHFCEEVHSFPDTGKGFPIDRNIPLLLSMKHCTEHEAAKKSFSSVTQLLEKLITLDKEDFVIDYFERVEADILLAKEVNIQKLNAYYQELVEGVHERKVKCLRNLATNETLASELDAIIASAGRPQRPIEERQSGFSTQDTGRRRCEVETDPIGMQSIVGEDQTTWRGAQKENRRRSVHSIHAWHE